MKRINKVALVGEPSTGKSTLFNRLIRQRKAIVGETRGITRDRLYGHATWLDKEFVLIDTGGLTIEKAPFIEQIKAQAEIAIDEADVIVFLVDGRKGLTSDTQAVAKILAKVRAKVILAVNKIDDQSLLGDAYAFYALGFGDPQVISAGQGIGIGDLLDDVVKKFPVATQEDAEQKDDESISFAVIGRPNVGKSSLINAILGNERTIVSQVAGTTRDAIDTRFTREGREYVAIDTAGLKKRGRIYESIDKYATLRALSAVEKCDVALVVIQADEELSQQDKNILGIAGEQDKPLVIIVNKWDLRARGENEQDKFKKELHLLVPFVAYVPVVFTSALNKKGLNHVFEAVDLVYKQASTRVQTSLLNSVVRDAQAANEAPLFHGGRLKIGYATQVGTNPPTFVLFVNNPEFMHFSYKRYMESTFRRSFGLDYVPIRIVLRTKQTGGFKL